nr:glycosyl hydrolase [Opitutae bacterium KCR 482]
MMKATITGIAALFAANACLGAGSDSEFYKYTNYNPDAPESAPIFEGFVSPKGKARVQTWWHWINSNVSREGIDRDLKSMSENNYGAAIIFNISGSDAIRAPEGAVKFNSKEWFENFAYTVETAKKYGMEIGIHNCDGWSEAGGPWITPELSMKRLTSSKVRAKGDGQVQSIKFPKPWMGKDHTKKGSKDYYEDIAVVAYPAFRPAEVAMKSALKSVKPANGITKFLVGKPDAMLDGDLKSALTFGATKGDYQSYGIDFEFEKPFEASSVFVNLKWSWFYPKNVFLLVSDDGKNFREIAELKFEKHSNEVYIKIPSTTAKYWRVEKRTSPSPTHYAQIRMNIGEIELVPSGTVPRNASFIPLFMVKVAADRSNIGLLPRGVEPVPAKAVIDPKKIIFVKEKISADGTMQWRVPEGEWEVIRVGFTTNGHTNHPASPAGVGLESDKLSAEATDFHFDSYISKMIDAAGDNAGSVFKYIETDSWECGPMNWTQKMPEEFKKLNGYDIMPWLPAMLGEIVESADATEKFAADLRKTTSHLVMKNFYGRLGERIRARGLKYESEPTNEASLKDQISLYMKTDIPQDEIWQGYREVGKPAVPTWDMGRMVASATSFFGKSMATCEALTQQQGNWSDSPLSLKGAIDTILTSGMNVLVFHDFAHQPDERVPGWQMEPWGSCINRKMPWFSLARDFFDYISRSQYMLQQGKACVRVLRLMKEVPPIAAAHPKLPSGIFSDRINGECVRNYLRVKDGKLVSPGRIEYDFLDISSDAALRLETLAALKKLVSEGAIVNAEKRPEFMTLSGGKKALSQWSELSRELFGDGKKGIVKIGKGKVYFGYSAWEMAQILKIRQSYITSVDRLSIMPRVHVDGKKWFYVVNRSENDRTFEISFDATGKAEIWNPETAARTEILEKRESDGYTRVKLEMRRNDSLFVVFTPSPKKVFATEISLDGKKTFPNEKPSGEIVQNQPRLVRAGDGLSAEFFNAGEVAATLSDGAKVSAKAEKVRKSVNIKTPFTVEFEEKYGAPKSAEFEKFASWTENSDPRIANYSGKGVYKLSVNLPKLGKDERAYLRFGNVMEIGRVKVNGKFAGTLWKRPFVLDITKFAKSGSNKIEVEVGNTWVNRCLYDATLPADQRITWSNSMGYHFPEKGKKPVPARGIDRSWKQGAIPSGIIGAAEVVFSKTVPLK